MVLREKQEKTEDLILGPFAAKSAETKGRQREEEKCDIRTDFQRDMKISGNLRHSTFCIVVFLTG